jgi:hypothetical protein
MNHGKFEREILVLKLAKVTEAPENRDIPLEPKRRHPGECPELPIAVGAIFLNDGCWSVGNYEITNMEHSVDP